MSERVDAPDQKSPGRALEHASDKSLAAARAAGEQVTVREEARWPRVALKLPVWAGATAVAVLLPSSLNQSNLYLVNAALVTAVAGLGLNLLMGYTGQVSIGNAAFLGIGAYASVVVNEFVHLPLVLSVILGGSVAAAISFGVGIPSLRLRGLYLAIGTLALHFIAVYVFQRIQGDRESGFIVDAPPYTLQQWYWISLGFFALCTYLVWNLLRSRLGRAFMAVRSSELAAEGMGINVRRVKLLSFALSGFLVGMAGSLLSNLQGTVNWENFSLDLAFQHLAIVIIGGMGFLFAGLLGSLVVTLLPQAMTLLGLGNDPNTFLLQDAAYGALIVIFLLVKPGGLSLLISDAVHLIMRLTGLRREAVRTCAKGVEA